jgi:hypothetical protein
LVRLTQENLEKTLENSDHIATFLFKDHLAGWMEGQKTAACRESIDLDKNDFHGLTRHYQPKRFTLTFSYPCRDDFAIKVTQPSWKDVTTYFSYAAQETPTTHTGLFIIIY